MPGRRQQHGRPSHVATAALSICASLAAAPAPDLPASLDATLAARPFMILVIRRRYTPTDYHDHETATSGTTRTPYPARRDPCSPCHHDVAGPLVQLQRHESPNHVAPRLSGPSDTAEANCVPRRIQHSASNGVALAVMWGLTRPGDPAELPDLADAPDDAEPPDPAEPPGRADRGALLGCAR